MYRELRRSIINETLKNFRDVLLANNGIIVKNNQGETLLDLSGAGGGSSSISIDIFL